MQVTLCDPYLSALSVRYFKKALYKSASFTSLLLLVLVLVLIGEVLVLVLETKELVLVLVLETYVLVAMPKTILSQLPFTNRGTSVKDIS